MARKRATKVQTTTTRDRVGKAVRLDLPPEVYARLEKAAEKRGLTKASYSRQAVMEKLMADEAGAIR